MRTIGLFGGSFNPPHVGHQLVALYVLETQAIDELWFVPTVAHPFGKALAPYDDRVAMCELVAAALGARAHVSRAEAVLAARPGFVASRTLDLIDDLIATHADAQFRLIVGADILAETAKWHRWEDVVARAPLIVVGRAGHVLPAGSHATDVTMPELSATAVRERLARLAPDARAAIAAGGAGADATGVASLLPRQVLRYIAEHDLYRGLS